MKNIKYILYLYILNTALFSEFVNAAVGTKELDKGKENTNIILGIFSTELLFNILFALFAIIVTIFISKIVTSRLTSYLENSYGGEESGRQELVGVISRTVNIIILSLGFTITLTILGIDMGIFLGGLGFGIGFTLKIFLTNFIGGILMVTQGFYHIGDNIEVGGKTGKIKNIHALFTSVEQFDGVMFFVPNVKFLEESVSNFHSNDKRRVDVNIGVDYDTDILKAKKVMMQVIDKFPNILTVPSPDVFITEMGDSSIDLSLRFWINSKDGFYSSKSNVTETINLAFKQAGITIPFPQITLSNRNDFKVGIIK